MSQLLSLCSTHQAILVATLLLFNSCRNNTPVEPPPILADTTAIGAQRVIDSLENKATASPAVIEYKCKQIEESPFKQYGCCAEICADGLKLKPQDCCCEAVITAYEKLYQEKYNTKKGRAELGKIGNDFIMVKCNKRYPEKIKAIKEKYVPEPEAGAVPYDPYN
jgi:hypothetical protein